MEECYGVEEDQSVDMMAKFTAGWLFDEFTFTGQKKREAPLAMASMSRFALSSYKRHLHLGQDAAWPVRISESRPSGLSVSSVSFFSIQNAALQHKHVVADKNQLTPDAA